MKEHPSPSQSQTVMLADNFPSKAFLLITHLTTEDPGVCTFSHDGNSFEIHDQSMFAQKYLPQYFKHSNYGSFVRQLNLYGFSSSRLKQNNDVVVWSHELFHRDRKDLIREIKRAKKTKSTSVATSSHVRVNPRSPSPPPLLSDASSSSEVNRKSPGGKGIGALDRVWLESEFTHLKRQNKFLEEKLDTLLKVTARISLSALGPAFESEEGEQIVGAKRRRMRSIEERDQMSPVESSRTDGTHNRYALAFEEQKLFDGDNYGIQPTSYDEDSRKPPPAYEDCAVNGNANEYEFGSRDRNDSLKRFVDIMLSEDDDQDDDDTGNGQWRKRCKGMDSKNEPESKDEETEYNCVAAAAVAPLAHRSHSRSNVPKSPPTDVVENILDDELMEEARLHCTQIDDTDGDLFAQIEDDQESVLIPDDSATDGSTTRLQTNPGHSNKMLTATNADRGKSDGPSPVHTISADVPDVHSADIEEGELPLGVAVIAAEAELVEEDNNGNDETLHGRQEDHEQRHRRRILILLAFIGAVLVVGVTWPAVALKRNKKMIAGEKLKDKGGSSSFDGKPGQLRHPPCPSGSRRLGGHCVHPPPCPSGSRQVGGRCFVRGGEEHPLERKPEDQDDEYDDEDSEGDDSDEPNGVDPAIGAEIDRNDQLQGSDTPKYALNATQVWRLATRLRRHVNGGQGENSDSISDDLRDDESSGVVDSFIVVLGGNGYSCSLDLFL